MKKSISFYLILFLLIFASSIQAQDRVQTEAYLQKNSIKIGEQVDLRLSVRYREGTQKSVVIWPDLLDTLTAGVEILKFDTINTRLVDRASVLYEQTRHLTITCFDSGTYHLPPVRFIVDNDTVQTDTLLFFVRSIPVDTTKPIKDIKDIFGDVPPPPAEADNGFNWWLAGAITLVVGIIVFLLVWLNRKKKKDIPVPVKNVYVSMPHEEVLEKLYQLQRDRPWISGNLKTYHSTVTDIMRGWITTRFRLHATEMTSSEILRAMKRQQLVTQSDMMRLEHILRIADMVKFAKGIPSTEENEQSVQTAIEFVRATIPVIIQPGITGQYPQQ
jgi:hypothetical protein